MFPFPFTAYIHTWSVGSDDGYTTADVYTPARTVTGTAVSAFWASASTVLGGAEPRLAGHDRVVVDVDLFVPQGTVISAHDLVDLAVNGGSQFEVIGDPQDYNHGPFGVDGWPLLVSLRRVTG